MEAFLEVFRKRQRPVVSPNVGFMAQLCALEESLRGSAAPSLDLAAYSQNRFADIALLRVPAPLEVEVAGADAEGDGDMSTMQLPGTPCGHSSPGSSMGDDG